ncbi:MAG: hypothetical protein ACFB13_02240 [Kiloniellaceae bacterium]
MTFALISLAMSLLILDSPRRYHDEGRFLLLLAGVGFFLTYFAFHRKRWAFVLLTIWSLNPLFWVINAFYLPRRWRAMDAARQPARGAEGGKSEGAGSPDRTSPKMLASFQRQDRSTRVALFLAGAWVLAVPLYVLLARPYGYVSDDDLLHMIMVMVIPAGFGLGLFWFFRRFVR